MLPSRARRPRSGALVNWPNAFQPCRLRRSDVLGGVGGKDEVPAPRAVVLAVRGVSGGACAVVAVAVPPHAVAVVAESPVVLVGGDLIGDWSTHGSPRFVSCRIGE